MNFTYENQGGNVFLVYEMQPQDVLDTISLGMITNNRINGLAQTVFMQIDHRKIIKYNISSKVSVSQVFNGIVNKKRLLGVLRGIVDAMLSAQDYMIEEHSLLLDLEYMFTDVSTSETVVICLPIQNSANATQDMISFFKNLVFNIKFDQSENCDHVAQILNYLNGTIVFSAEEFKKLLERVSRGESRAPAYQQPVAQPAVQYTPPKPVVQESIPQPVNLPTPQIASHPVTLEPISQPDAPLQSLEAESDEKPMSFLYLMQHYNKENAAIYKAQQEAKKSSAAENAVASKEKTKKSKKEKKPEKEKKPKKEKKQNTKASGAQAEFHIPGQDNFDFAIPGRNAAAPAAAAIKPEKPKAPAPQPARKSSLQQQTPPQMPIQQPVRPLPVADFGETTVLGGGMIGETTVLNATTSAQSVMPHLIRTRNNERIPLDKPVFRIGKERSYVDYFISGNAAVSRSHANLITRNGEYFVIDTNSTNHTYLNGKMIPSSTEKKIEHGDKIRFADEDFEFRLY